MTTFYSVSLIFLDYHRLHTRHSQCSHLLTKIFIRESMITISPQRLKRINCIVSQRLDIIVSDVQIVLNFDLFIIGSL